MTTCPKCPSENDVLRTEILKLSRRIINPRQLVACSIYGDYVLETSTAKALIEVLLVVRGFQPKLMSRVKGLNGRTVVFVAVDQWVFERDVESEESEQERRRKEYLKWWLSKKK